MKKERKSEFENPLSFQETYAKCFIYFFREQFVCFFGGVSSIRFLGNTKNYEPKSWKMLPFGGWHLLKCCGQSWCEPDLMMLVFDFRMISLRKKAGLAAKFFYRHHVDSIRPQEIAGKWWLFVYLGNGWFLGSTPKYVHSCMIQKGESARLKTPSFWCSKGILQGTSIPHHGKRKSSLPKCSWVFVYSLSYNNLIIYFLQWLDINWWINQFPSTSKWSLSSFK